MKKILTKYKTAISVIVVIMMIFLARSMYSDYNLNKVISACVLSKSQNSSIAEAKKTCADKLN